MLVWSRFFALQFVLGEIGGLGIRPVLTRPLLDIYLGPLTLALGRHPEITDAHACARFSCRGFFVATPRDPVL
jgi:hypothetical protein